MHYSRKVQIFGISGNPENLRIFFTCFSGFRDDFGKPTKKMANKHRLSAILYIIPKKNLY